MCLHLTKVFAGVLLLCQIGVCRPAAADPAAAANPAAERGGHAVVIVDDAGKTVALRAPARRIVPLYAALGETLAAMGLTEYVVGRTASDDTLPASLPAVGTHMRPNLELVAALRPDLVVMLEGREEAGLAAEALGRLGIPVARFRVASFADLFSCVSRLGVLAGEPARADSLAASMRERLAGVEKKTAVLTRRPTVFFEVRYPNLLGAGGGSMPADIIRAAGGRNCLDSHSARMVRLSEEALLLLDPDIYLIQEGPMNKRPIPLDSRPHFRDLTAVRERFFFMVAETRFSRPGPQSILAVEELADIFLRWNGEKKRQSAPAIPEFHTLKHHPMHIQNQSAP